MGNKGSDSGIQLETMIDAGFLKSILPRYLSIVKAVRYLKFSKYRVIQIYGSRCSITELVRLPLEVRNKRRHSTYLLLLGHLSVGSVWYIRPVTERM